MNIDEKQGKILEHEIILNTIASLEMQKYEVKVEIFKQTRSFIATIVLGFFWAWCSSSSDSNIVIFWKSKKYIVVLIIAILTFGCFAFLLFRLIETLKKLRQYKKTNFLMMKYFWDNIFYLFLFSINNCEILRKDAESVYFSIKENVLSKQKIFFNRQMLYDFIYGFYVKNKCILSKNFFDYLTDYILLSLHIAGQVEIKDENQYSYIINRNEIWRAYGGLQSLPHLNI